MDAFFILVGYLIGECRGFAYITLETTDSSWKKCMNQTRFITKCIQFFFIINCNISLTFVKVFLFLMELNGME